MKSTQKSKLSVNLQLHFIHKTKTTRALHMHTMCLFSHPNEIEIDEPFLSPVWMLIWENILKTNCFSSGCDEAFMKVESDACNRTSRKNERSNWNANGREKIKIYKNECVVHMDGYVLSTPQTYASGQLSYDHLILKN